MTTKFRVTQSRKLWISAIAAFGWLPIAFLAVAEGGEQSGMVASQFFVLVLGFPTVPVLALLWRFAGLAGIEVPFPIEEWGVLIMLANGGVVYAILSWVQRHQRKQSTDGVLRDGVDG